VVAVESLPLDCHDKSMSLNHIFVAVEQEVGHVFHYVWAVVAVWRVGFVYVEEMAIEWNMTCLGLHQNACLPMVKAACGLYVF